MFALVYFEQLEQDIRVYYLQKGIFHYYLNKYNLPIDMLLEVLVY
jgi:hypothetical protein